jgi:hypothetical protein
MPESIAREQTCVGAPVTIEIAEHMYEACMWRPDTKCGPVGNQVRTHRGAWMNVIKRGRHERTVG